MWPTDKNFARAHHHRRRGFSLLEVLMAVFLLSLLSIITVMGMIMHARVAKSNLMQQRMAENSRRFLDAVQVAALDSTVIRVDDGPAGADTVLTLEKPNPDNPTATIITQYAYLDPDNNPATIGDNVLVMRNTDTPSATTGEAVISYCSPVSGKAVFSRNEKAAKPLFDINLRVGDRTFPGNAEDNRFTGNGTQMYRLVASISTL